MKRWNILILIMCSSLILTSCITFKSNWDERPNIENDIKWVSQNPNIWFAVQDGDCYGEISANDEVYEVVVGIDQSVIEFFPASAETESALHGDEFLFLGHWKYKVGADTFSVDVFNNSKGFLDETIKTISFVKEDFDTGPRWYDQYESKWISNDPDIWFEVGRDNIHFGEMNINDEITRIIIKPDSGSAAWVVYSYEENEPVALWENRLFRIACRYGIDEIYARVLIFQNREGVEGRERVFEEENKVITFVKEQLE